MSKAIIDAARNAGLDVRSYSGRGMFGAKCLGIDCDSPVKAVIELTKAFMDNNDISDDGIQYELYQMLGALKDARTDSMGLGSIVYWPRLRWLAEYDEVSDDCEDCDRPNDDCECDE